MNTKGNLIMNEIQITKEHLKSYADYSNQGNANKIIWRNHYTHH